MLPLGADGLSALVDQTRLLGRLIDDLKTLSLADAGQLALHRRAVDVDALTSSVVRGFEAAAAATRCGIRRRAAEPRSSRTAQWLPSSVASSAADSGGSGGPPERLTINDVARITGLSKATVSRAMSGRDRVAPETRARVMAVLAHSGYTPDRAARSLSTGRTGLIGLTIGENRNPTMLSVIDGAVEVAEAAGLRIVVSVTRSARDNAQMYADVFRGRMVDGGLLMFPPAPDVPILEKLAGTGFPLVAIEPELPIPGVTGVYADARDDGLVATRHLVSLGHRRIAVSLDAPGWGEQDRLLDGHRAALAEAGLVPDDRLVARLGWDHAAGGAAVRTWWSLDERPTAAIFCSDTSALGAVAAVRDLGGQVPADLSVVGYDDSDVLSWFSPPVTSLRRRRSGLTRRACEILIQQLGADRVPVAGRRVQTDLVVRGSTARVDPATRH